MSTFRHSGFLFGLIFVLSASGKFPTGGWQLDLLAILGYVPMYTLTPRFILSIRELYKHDVQGGPRDGIDTGFGLSSAGYGAGDGTAIVFAGAAQSGEPEDLEEIPMELGTSHPEARMV